MLQIVSIVRVLVYSYYVLSLCIYATILDTFSVGVSGEGLGSSHHSYLLWYKCIRSINPLFSLYIIREYPIGRAFVDARVQSIYGGANEVDIPLLSSPLFLLHVVNVLNFGFLIGLP